MLQDFTNSVNLKSWKQFNHLLELSTKFSHYGGVETFLQKQPPARHVYCKEEIEITVSDIKPKMLSLLHVILALNGTVPALENAICSYLEQVSNVCLEPLKTHLIKHTQTIAEELFECVWPFSRVRDYNKAPS